MKISIITSTYNSESFLRDCLKSMAGQDYSDIEHIVVDNVSTDDTLNILKQKLEKNLILISEPDKGIYDAINKGISIASGDIIGILHSDDEFSNSSVLSSIQEYFFNNPEVEILFGNVKFIANNGTRKFLRLYQSKYFRRWMFRFGFMPAHTAAFVRREIYEKFGNYRTDFKSAGDFEFFVRTIGDGGVTFRFLDQTLVHMRVGGTSTAGIASYIRTSKELLKALRIHNIYSNYIFIYSRLPIKWIYKIFNRFKFFLEFN